MNAELRWLDGSLDETQLNVRDEGANRIRITDGAPALRHLVSKHLSPDAHSLDEVTFDLLIGGRAYLRCTLERGDGSALTHMGCE